MTKQILKGYMMLHAAKANGKLTYKEAQVIKQSAGILSLVIAYLVQLFQTSYQIETIIKKLSPQIFNSEDCKQKAIEAIKEVYWADDEWCTSEQRHFFATLRFFENKNNTVLRL